MLTIMKGLPISYYKDLQDDKALVFDSYDTLKDTVSMAIELITNLNTKKDNMKSMAQKGYTTATDFADYLVKKKNLPFREAYVTSSKLVNYAERKKVRLDQLSVGEINKFIKKFDIDNIKMFDVVSSMNSKTSYGGTASKNIKKMIKKYKSEINYVIGDEWYAGNLSYHLKSRPKWISINDKKGFELMNSKERISLEDIYPALIIGSK